MDIEYSSPLTLKRSYLYTTPEGKQSLQNQDRISLLQNAAKIKKKFNNPLNDKENFCKKLFDDPHIDFDKLSKEQLNKEQEKKQKISKQALKHLQLFISEFNLKSSRILEFFSDDSQFEVLGVSIFSTNNALKILNAQNLRFEAKDTDYNICDSKEKQKERIITITNGRLQSQLSKETVQFILSAKITADELLENCKITYIKMKLSQEKVL